MNSCHHFIQACSFLYSFSASIFGESSKLEPMPEERKARWRKEIGWLLGVTDNIVEFVPSLQKTQDGKQMEVIEDSSLQHYSTLMLNSEQ